MGDLVIVSSFKTKRMKISVITATWNSGKTIEDTIKSVFQQKYRNIEHIIKDGGSKDNTVVICQDYKQLFYSSTDGPGTCVNTMKILSDKDNGIYDAMNQGIEASMGDVIGILNSDDFFTSDDVLQRVAEEFQKDPSLEAIYGDIHFVKDENLEKCTRYFSSKYFYPWALRFGFMPAHPSFYVRREVYEKYGLYDLEYRTSSDFEMMVRLFVKYKIKAKYINKDFVTMRDGGESTAGLEAKRKVYQDIADSLKKHGVYSNLLFQSLRYIWRIGELSYTKVRF